MFALLQLTFLEYKGVNEKLLLFLAVSLETELSKLSAILDLSDLSTLSAKHELAISKSVVINRFILVNYNHQNVTELISSGELVFYICTPESEIKDAQHRGDCLSQQSEKAGSKLRRAKNGAVRKFFVPSYFVTTLVTRL